MSFTDLINEVAALPEPEWESRIQSFSLETLVAAAGLEFPISDTDLETFLRNENKEIKQVLHGEQDEAAREHLFVRCALYAELVIKFKKIPYVYNKPTPEEEGAYQEELVVEKEFMEEVRKEVTAKSYAVIRSAASGVGSVSDAVKKINELNEELDELKKISSFNPFKESRQIRFGFYENRPVPTEQDKRDISALVRSGKFF